MKIAGVKVGKIDVARRHADKKAAVVLDDRRAGLPGLPRRRDVHDPPAVADRREVRRVRADPAARAPARRPPPPLKEIEEGDGEGQHLLPVDADLEAGRPRPDQQHPAPALPPAPRDHPQRARHRPGRPRRGRSRGDPQRQPRAQGARRRPQDPRRAEPDARRAGRRTRDEVLAPLARDRDAASPASSVQRPDGRRGDAPSAARDFEENFAKLPGVPARAAADDGRASARSPTQMTPVVARPRRGRRPTINRSHRQLGPFSDAGDAVARSRSARRPTSAARRCTTVAADRSRTSATLGDSGRAARRRTSATLLVSAAASTGGIERPAGLSSTRSPADQRLRRVRPLPARPARSLGTVLDLRRPSASTPSCSANFNTGPRRRRRTAGRRATPRRRRAAGDRRRDGRDAGGSRATPASRAPPRGSTLPAPLLPGDERGRRTPAHEPGRASAGAGARGTTAPSRPCSTTCSGLMCQARRGTSIAANPVLIGAATTLVVIVAVFLAYNANNGLPFVPTYTLRSRSRTRPASCKGNEVRVGGTRVGVVDEITPGHARGRHASPAMLDAQARDGRQAAADDSTVLVRPRSALGLKYVEITRGTGSTRASRTARRCRSRRPRPSPVEIDEFFNTFDETTRAARRSTSRSSATRFAGRGADINHAIQELDPLLRRPAAGDAATSPSRADRPARLLPARSAQTRGRGRAGRRDAGRSCSANLDTTFTALADVARPVHPGGDQRGARRRSTRRSRASRRSGRSCANSAALFPSCSRASTRCADAAPDARRGVRGGHADRCKRVAGVQRAPGDHVQERCRGSRPTRS